MFTVQQPQSHCQTEKLLEFNSTDLKNIKANESWNFCLVLNYKDVSKAPCWTMEQLVGKEHQNVLKGLKTVVGPEENKNRIWLFPWHV